MRKSVNIQSGRRVGRGDGRPAALAAPMGPFGWMPWEMPNLPPTSSRRAQRPLAAKNIDLAPIPLPAFNGFLWSRLDLRDAFRGRATTKMCAVLCVNTLHYSPQADWSQLLKHDVPLTIAMKSRPI